MKDKSWKNRDTCRCKRLSICCPHSWIHENQPAPVDQNGVVRKSQDICTISGTSSSPVHNPPL
ncbi:hypothetical protein DPMN_194957 [Dreissena polymorpha]|uniref:Uncharacterized protein n=1 Tax=Dreissena polymorpha TaxID=45954 RepID=A0A9D3Y559_DREPO|nr:hypothetical protein DPMN_194957 [Dreissena polymorpha]